MEGAKDFVGIGIPFAAGVAAGAVLFPFPYVVHPLHAAVLIALTGSLGVLAARHLDSRTPPSMTVAAVGILFLLGGLSCSASSTLSSGIPTWKGPLTSFAALCKDSLTARIDSIPYPSPSTSSMIKALLTGDRSGLDSKTVELFRNSGASHILALSGLHLGIIYLILSKLTLPLGNSPVARRMRYSWIVAASGFYTLMTGAGPSIVRAFIFIFLHETAKLLGRKASTSRILLSALTIQLAMEPEVITSTGFQLSYLAMLGITLLYPPLRRIYPEATGTLGRLDPMRRIWEAAMLSISCQVFTAPLAWFRFHTFPRYFLLTNLMVLPLTSAVMVLSVTTTALSFIGTCPHFLVVLNDSAVGTMVYCLETISSLQGPSLP
ncbi:MAG: ComEC/Rec2 family competence protein [Bacteroidales bacterium]|nr:ComEC/Rec2 family competence protein [Bacteroidales bacterium]